MTGKDFFHILSLVLFGLAFTLFLLWIADDPIWSHPDDGGHKLYHFQTLIAGIFALGGGSFIFIVVKKQIRASIKEKWMHDFKADVSSFLSLTSTINGIVKEAGKIFPRIHEISGLIESAETLGRDTTNLRELLKDVKAEQDSYYRKFEEKKEEASVCSHSLQIFLDYKKPSHRQLMEQISEWNTLSRHWENIVFGKHDDNFDKDTALKKSHELMGKVKTAIIIQTKKIIDEETEALSR